MTDCMCNGCFNRKIYEYYSPQCQFCKSKPCICKQLDCYIKRQAEESRISDINWLESKVNTDVVNLHKRIDYLEDNIKRLIDSIADIRIELGRKKDE